MKPVVSVVMSVLNGEKHLRKTIESILDQSYSNFEFIIINDGSTDKTQSILDEYKDQDKRIINIANDKNIGLPKSLNKGLTASRGSYVARIDAGDIWEKEKLKAQIAYLDSHPDTILLGTQAVFIDEEGNECGKTQYPTNDQAIMHWFLNCNNPFLHSSVMFKPLDAYSDQFFTVTEDFELWTRLYFRGKLSNLDQFLVRYRLSPGRITKNKRANQIFQSFEIYKRFMLTLEKSKTGGNDSVLPIPLNSKDFSSLRSKLFADLNYFGNSIKNNSKNLGTFIVFLSYLMLPQILYIKLKLLFLIRRGQSKYGSKVIHSDAC